MHDKKVSIIVPVYNAVQTIERCVKSIIEQTYENIEIILIEDGSEDDSFVLCKKMSMNNHKIHVIKEEENRGVVSARNKGIENSTGEYIMFVDADDWIERDMVETLILNIGNADVISTGVYWEKYPGEIQISIDDYEEGLYKTSEQKREFFSKMIFDLSKNILHPLTPWMWNKMYCKELVQSVYKYLDTTITFAEDTTFLYKCFLKADSFVILHQPFYHYCFNEQSVCHNEQRNILTDINKVYISLYEECKYHNDEHLLEQMQNWIILMTRVALNERMHFHVKTHIPEFLVDVRDLSQYKKIIIYGAGQAGQDFYYQLKKLGYLITLWVDSNYIYWRRQGMDIHPPKDIRTCEYDAILISISSESTMKKIKSQLISIGIEETKIIWKKPIAL